MSEQELLEAYHLWLRSYRIQSKVLNSGSLKIARKALFLTSSEISQALRSDHKKILNTEKRELRGAVTLSAMSEVAEAMGCDFVYAVIPKPGSDGRPREFPNVIWEKILPSALNDPRVKSAQPLSRARVLAAVAREIIERRRAKTRRI